MEDTDHPRCGPTFYRICKATKSYTGRWVVLCKLSVATDGLQALSHVLWMHEKVLTTLGYNTYIDLPRCCPCSDRSAKNHYQVTHKEF